MFTGIIVDPLPVTFALSALIRGVLVCLGRPEVFGPEGILKKK